MKRGLAVEYTSKEAVVAAIGALRRRGYTKLETYTPYPVHEIDEALGAKRSPLALAAGLGGLAGALAAYALQWWLDAYLYPLDVGGRPPHMPLPFIIITIEMGFLVGAGTVFCAFLIACRLLKLWEPIFEVEGFESATRDGFWLAVDATDPRWDRETLLDALRDTGSARTHGFGGIG